MYRGGIRTARKSGDAPSSDNTGDVRWKRRVVNADRSGVIIELDTGSELKQRDVVL